MQPPNTTVPVQLNPESRLSVPVALAPATELVDVNVTVPLQAQTTIALLGVYTHRVLPSPANVRAAEKAFAPVMVPLRSALGQL